MPPKPLWLDRKTRLRLEKRSCAGNDANFTYAGIPETEKTAYVHRQFNAVAHRYDLMNTILSFGIHHLWKRTAIRMLGLDGGARVLDVCGGTGDLAILAARSMTSPGPITVYDINRAMMRAGRSKIETRACRHPIRHVQGNAENLSFPAGSFDAVMVGFGIRNVTDMQRAFSEMHRVLRPGGKMVCLEFSKPPGAVIRWLYDRYSFYVIPLLGEIITGSRQAYTHLPESIRMFPLPDELSAMLESIGFARVTHRRLTFGIAVIHLAVKA